MKDFTDYPLDADIQRQLERDSLGIEVPYLAEYTKWMVDIDERTQGTANDYVSYIKMVNKSFFSREFFYLLSQKIKEEDSLGIASLLDEYLEVIDKWYEDAKRGIVDYSPKRISDWRSGFRNYCRFIKECILPTINRQKTNISDKKVVTNYERLFAEHEFSLWLIKTDKTRTGSAQSYISRLKKLNRIISKTIPAKSREFEGDIFSLIPKWLKEQKGSDVVKLLEGIEEKLLQQVNSNDTHLMPIPALRNSVSALRTYTEFLLEEYIGDVSGDDASSTEKITEVNQIGNGSKIENYDYPTLEKNFYHRLTTQDRMSNGKAVFFPIGMINRLFSLSAKTPIDGIVHEGEDKWFNRWIDNCIAEIRVITDRGFFIMAELRKYDTLIINTTTKEVTVTLQDGETAKMLTFTEDKAESPRLMKVDRLRDIHIDHTPLISNVLSENISNLPAMVRLTEIMRKVAKTSNLSFKTNNFSAIENKVINSNADVVEMLKMLPMIKDELELVRSKSTLCLMDAKHNRKKK